MIDIALLRAEPERFKKIAQDKGVVIDIDTLLQLDTEWRHERAALDVLLQRKNQHVGKGKPSDAAVQAGKRLKEEIAQQEKIAQQLHEQRQELLLAVPNVASDDTPVGKDETENKIMRTVGEKPHFAFAPKTHWELGKQLGIIDSERAAEIVGSRFTYLKGPAVLIEFALISFAFSVLTDRKKLQRIAADAHLDVADTPFLPVVPPVMVRPDVMQRMARLEPKEERYYIPSDDLYLVGSAEHTLGPLHMDETLSPEELPLRYVGFSTAFRREAGSHGKDVRGILRLHQFDKLEIESFTTPEQSDAEQQFIVALQEYFMQQLEIPYHVVLKCTGDMGAPNWRAIDIESWLPSQQLYRETHTSDHMGDYQARRLKTRIKRPVGTVYAHMNDATVFAIGRTLIALLENHQQADGSVRLPAALHPYLPFKTIES